MIAFNTSQTSITNPNRFVQYIGDVPGFDSFGFGELIDGSRSERYNEREFTATMNFICNWEHRFSVASLLAQSIYPIPTDSYNGLAFADTYFDPICIDTSISVFAEPGKAAYPLYRNSADPQNKTIAYTTAKISASYKAFAKPSVWNVDISYNPQVEARTLSPYGFYWESDRSPIQESETPTIVEFSLGIELGFKNLVAINDVIWTMDAHVFNFPFTDAILGQSFAPGTLLFSVKNLTRSIAHSREIDDRLWSLSVSFLYNPIGWHKHRRPSSLVNYGDSMFMDSIVREDGSPFFSYPNLNLVRNFELFKLITDPTTPNPFI